MCVWVGDLYADWLVLGCLGLDGSDLRRMLIGRGFGASLELDPAAAAAVAVVVVPVVPPRWPGLTLATLASGDERLRAEEREESLDAESFRARFREGVLGSPPEAIFRDVLRVAWEPDW